MGFSVVVMAPSEQFSHCASEASHPAAFKPTWLCVLGLARRSRFLLHGPRPVLPRGSCPTSCCSLCRCKRSLGCVPVTGLLWGGGGGTKSLGSTGTCEKPQWGSGTKWDSRGRATWRPLMHESPQREVAGGLEQGSRSWRLRSHI